MQRVVAVLALLPCFACGPIVMLPGGALTGDVKPTPGEWSFSDAVDTVQLETNPDDPYSVNVWGVGSGSHFYIAAGDGQSRWAENLRANPNARVRIEDGVYELTATEVGDEAEIEQVLAALQKKYDFEPDPEQREGAALFRFGAR